MKWGRILLAGIGVPVAAVLLVTLLTTGYACKLAFEVRGAPDQARIGQFAGNLGRSYWWILQIVLTAPAAAWAVRKVQGSRLLHGVLVGAIVALAGFAIGFTLSLRTVAECALTVGAGWLGAVVVERRRRKQDRDRPTKRDEEPAR